MPCWVCRENRVRTLCFGSNYYVDLQTGKRDRALPNEPFLDKAEESLTGARREVANKRYQNAANRAYYACYQAAIAALHREGIQAPGKRWGHDTVRAQFAGELIKRRKLYPSELRDTFERLGQLRQLADYEDSFVIELPAVRAVRRAGDFIDAVQNQESKKHE